MAGFNDLLEQGNCNNQPDTSTLGDALFFDSFVLQLNRTTAETRTTAQLQLREKPASKSVRAPAGLRPSS